MMPESRLQNRPLKSILIFKKKGTQEKNQVSSKCSE
jgi:hypothetical protein